MGAALGFPPFSVGDFTQPPQCAPTIAHRLKRLYKACLDYVLFAKLTESLRLSQISAQPSQRQAHPHQSTEADYQVLLANIPQDSSAMTPKAISILPRVLHTSDADLEAHRVPSHIVSFVDQHRDHLQRAAQDQNGFGACLTSAKNLLLDNRAQITQAREFLGRIPPLAYSQSYAITGPAQLNNGVDLLARASTAQSMGASSMSSMGIQITGAGSNGGAQDQSG